MPFADDFQDIYECIKISLDRIDLSQKIKCIRLDELKKPGKITDDLISEIIKSQICIADITGNNPNVMWEVGYAMALNKPLILLTQDIKHLPFDLKDRRTIVYNRTNFLSKLGPELNQTIIETLSAFEFKTDDTLTDNPTNDIFSISVTGTMNVDINRCWRRIQTIINPYLKKNIVWYIGSYGIVDEQVTKYLCEKKEKVVIVGYHQFDISHNMLELIRNNNLLFIDAQKEQLPKLEDAPTIRDIYMSVKTNLTIIIWNGKSEGTRKLINWYTSINKDFLVGFC